MRSLKEKGGKPVSNDAFKIYNIYRRLNGWVVRGQPAKFDLFQKGISPHSPLKFAIFYKVCQSLSIFRVFSCQANYKISYNL